MSRPKFLVLFCLAACIGLVAIPPGAGHETAPPRPIVGQAKVGEFACGPCAIYNTLVCGDPKLCAVAAELPGDDAFAKIRYLIDKYGLKPSEEYGGKKPRYDDKSGVTWHDLRHFVNDVLRDHQVPPVEGRYLDRDKGETPLEQLRRVHALLRESLAAGFPPILAVRSFYAKQEKDTFLWNGLCGHWVTVVDLPRSIPDREKGFRFGFADPGSGRVEYGYAYAEVVRDFTAAKGNAERWEWISGRPFLLLTAPALPLYTQKAPWHSRTIVTLNYAVYRASTRAQTPPTSPPDDGPVRR